MREILCVYPLCGRVAFSITSTWRLCDFVLGSYVQLGICTFVIVSQSVQHKSAPRARYCSRDTITRFASLNCHACRISQSLRMYNASLNVAGWLKTAKTVRHIKANHKSVESWLQQHNFDVLCLQEVKTVKDQWQKHRAAAARACGTPRAASRARRASQRLCGMASATTRIATSLMTAGHLISGASVC
jgi:hypothetical protein